MTFPDDQSPHLKSSNEKVIPADFISTIRTALRLASTVGSVRCLPWEWPNLAPSLLSFVRLG